MAIDLEICRSARRVRQGLCRRLRSCRSRKWSGLFVDGLEFEPDVEGVHGAAGEEVADFTGADYDVDGDIITTADGGVDATEWRGDGTGFSAGPCGVKYRILHRQRKL